MKELYEEVQWRRLWRIFTYIYIYIYLYNVYRSFVIVLICYTIAYVPLTAASLRQPPQGSLLEAASLRQQPLEASLQKARVCKPRGPNLTYLKPHLRLLNPPPVKGFLKIFRKTLKNGVFPRVIKYRWRVTKSRPSETKKHQYFLFCEGGGGFIIGGGG